MSDAGFFREGLVVLDASVLLDLSRITPQARRQVLDALSSVGGRLWVPHQAAAEFSATAGEPWSSGCHRSPRLGRPCVRRRRMPSMSWSQPSGCFSGNGSGVLSRSLARIWPAHGPQVPYPAGVGRLDVRG